MKHLWLPVALMMTVVFYYDIEDKESGHSSTQSPIVRVTDNGLQLVSYNEPDCIGVDSFFAEEVWGKVGERTCLKCHNAEGDAAESKFVLQATLQDRTALEKNRQAFLRMAKAQENGKSRLLLKVCGKLEHGGGEVLETDSTGYKILSRFAGQNTGTPRPLSA